MKQTKWLVLILTIAALALCLGACAKSEGGMKYKPAEGGVAITGYTDKTTVTALTVPDEIDGQPVVEIADFGICNAESLLTIRIGRNVAKIGAWGLTNNAHLQAFEVDPENATFTAVDGVLFSKDMKTLVAYPCGRGVSFDKYGRTNEAVTYDIPEGVETIASKAFYKCGHMDIGTFPATLKRIEEKAFFKCFYYEEFSKDNVFKSGLSNFELPEGVEFIGKDAFAYDELLTEVTLPSTVREIGEFAFFNCKAMEKLTVLAKESEITQGNKWQPTSKGRIIESCEVTFGS